MTPAANVKLAAYAERHRNDPRITAALEAQLPKRVANSSPTALPDLSNASWEVERTWSEHTHQCALIEWCDTAGHPFDLLAAIPNAAKRSPQQGAKMVREGLRKGYPDLFFARPAHGFHGLYIELKKYGGKPTPEQLAWRDRLRAEGYRAEIVEGWRAARNLLLDYLEGK